MGKKTAFKIEYMKKEDVDQVLAIEQASFSMPWSKNLFLSEFRSPAISTLMVSLDDKPTRTILGYIVFWTAAREMHILNLAVSPEFRKQGISRTLVHSALQEAYRKGAQRAFLEVRASNIAAQRLYSGMGFTGISMRKDYYDSPVEDAIIMSLEPQAFLRIVQHH
ncbi:MAG: ribosomal protein S18-alanine N-acetyltransferase [Nitrospirota bacterium]